MAHPSDLLIGLDVGTSSVRAMAFDRDGRELGAAATASRWAPVGEHGLEQDAAETWQAAARTLHRLAERVPDLARRTVALGLTGAGGGTWLIDDDGDPVAAALSPLDGRAADIVRAWRESGRAGAVAAVTGVLPGASMQSAQLAWLLAERPEAVAGAATVLQAKDWLYLCCTGERTTDATSAAATFGNWRTGSYDARVLDLLDLDEASLLLPPIAAGPAASAPLSPAAAAATWLREGTPVVLAPPRAMAAALALGLGTAADEVAVTVLGPDAVHLRAASLSAAADAPSGATRHFITPSTWTLSITTGAAEAGLEWLLGLIEEVVGASGLIGVSRGDLVALFEEKAAHAPPARVALCGLEGGEARARAVGTLFAVSAGTSVWDLVRALHEEAARAARAAHDALGDPPPEVRVAPGRYDGPLARRILAASLAAPLRVTRRAAPATAGAALVAAVALGQYGTAADGNGTWVERWLGDAEPVDPGLAESYGRASAPPR